MVELFVLTEQEVGDTSNLLDVNLTRPLIIHRREGKGCGYEGVCCLTWCWEV